MGLGWSGLGSLRLSQSVAGPGPAGWELWVLTGHLLPAPLGPLPLWSLRSPCVGWLGFPTAWPFRAPEVSVPGEPCRSYIAFCDLAQKPGHGFCKFTSTQIRGEGMQEALCLRGRSTRVVLYECMH